MPIRMEQGKYVLQYFFLIWLPLTLLTVIVTSALMHNQRQMARGTAAIEQQAQVESAQSLLSSRLSRIQADALYLAGQLALMQSDEQATSTFETFQRYHPQYYQIRLLDLNGHEHIRVELKG